MCKIYTSYGCHALSQYVTRCITESHNVHKFTLDATYVQKGVQLDESVRVAHVHGIDLGRSHRQAVLSNVQLPAVDDIRDLLRAKAPVTFCKDIQYGFFYLHLHSLDEIVTNSTFPSI